MADVSQAEHPDHLHGRVLIAICVQHHRQVFEVIAWEESLGDEDLLEADVSGRAWRRMVHNLTECVGVAIAAVQLVLAWRIVDFREVQDAVCWEVQILLELQPFLPVLLEQLEVVVVGAWYEPQECSCWDCSFHIHSPSRIDVL